VFADDGGFADDESAAVVDDESFLDGCGGVYFDVGEESAEKGDEQRGESQVHPPEAVREAVQQQRMQPGIKQKHVQLRCCRGVSATEGGEVLVQAFEEHCDYVLGWGELRGCRIIVSRDES